MKLISIAYVNKKEPKPKPTLRQPNFLQGSKQSYLANKELADKCGWTEEEYREYFMAVAKKL